MQQKKLPLSEEVSFFIAGYIAKQLHTKTHCDICTARFSGCAADVATGLCFDILTRGGLTIPSLELSQYVSQCFAVSSSSSFEGHPLQARHKQNWGRGFILLLSQTAALPGSDAGSDVVKPASSFVIQNRQTACSMWCPMYGAHC